MQFGNSIKIPLNPPLEKGDFLKDSFDFSPLFLRGGSDFYLFAFEKLQPASTRRFKKCETSLVNQTSARAALGCCDNFLISIS
jgi:hypothetical protein